ncbi:MAG: phosphodiester glycosidase family protein [Armatimonadetes bacterium]|nr:phosphodiester glycosidase family protein [Armatimonadota bacterium]
MSARRVARRRLGRLVFVILALCIAGVLVASQLGIFAQRGLLHKLKAEYITIDLTGGKYRACPAVAAKGRSEHFRSMVGRLKPYAAICGTYYAPDLKPLGDILINGKLVCQGGARQGIGFTSKGKIKFIERHGHSRMNWSGCVSGIACGPRLVRNGKKDINVKRDGFSASAATHEARRCAVGATADGKLILCVVPEDVTLSTMADAMLELGARDAVNMDGGSMCALYKNGKFLAVPVMPMSNILAVYALEK